MVDETQPAIENHDSRKRPGWRVGVLAATVLLTTALILTASFAAFSDTTDNSGNTWSAGTVVLTDDDGGGSAMFTVPDMAPLATVTECIVVTYEGSLLPADVNLYGVSGGGGLDAFLDLVIEEGSGGVFGNCAGGGGFTPTSTIFTGGTLADFATTHTNFGNGAGAWLPAANPESRTYRFTVTLQDDNLAQGLNATATFTWEAQA
ncbi:MAG: hypothetical protein IIC72_03655 [Acidobacteria bacterium]|nr:hypothetical protein [Acidobacteriota bacterium]